MDHDMRPRRSALYMPGSKPRALEKARSLPADVIILDLEDSVLPDEKVEARARVAEAVKSGGFGPREVVVRVNGADTGWSADDLAAVADCRPAGVVLPKVDDPQIAQVAADAVGPGVAVWAMIETPRGVLAAAEIAAVDQVACLVAGTNDLVAELRVIPDADRSGLSVSLQTIVMAARAAGVAALDGVFNAYKDTEGLARECAQGLALGFDGKTLIHPGQIAAANKAFGPTPADLDHAARVLAAFEDAAREGQGVGVLDGKIVENLHVAAARRLMAQKLAVDALEKETAQ